MVDNPRICQECHKLLSSHTESELKTCNHAADKRRQTVGRKAYSQCCTVNPNNPLAVAESVKDMYSALKAVLVNQAYNGDTWAALELARNAIRKAEEKSI